MSDATRLSAVAADALRHAARDAIEAAVLGRPPRPGPNEHDPSLRAPGASFVTLRTVDRQLRGCIGELEATRPLVESVRHFAVGAALRDPRFPPVGADELGALVLGISVLTPRTRVRPDQVEVGRHGVVIERGPQRGVLLPEVAVEQGWNARELLAATCKKAGLDEDAWRDPETAVHVFESIKLEG